MKKDYIELREGRYQYKRRVPKEYREVDGRTKVVVSLKTNDYEIAYKRADIVNAATESMWSDSLLYRSDDQAVRYKAAIKLALQHGVQYVPMDQLASGKLDEIIDRMKILQRVGIGNPAVVSAVLGGEDAPEFTMSEAFEKFVELSKDDLLGKNDDQLRKWKNPRKNAVTNFINLVGDKRLDQLTRNDGLDFREWWIEKIDAGDLTADAANKNIRTIGKIYNDLNDFMRLGLPVNIFSKLALSDNSKHNKHPFDRAFVSAKLVRNSALATLNPQAKMIIWAFASTGAGISELVGLVEDDIFPDAPIPYVYFRSNEVRGHEKTDYRERKIPIIGSALEAFQAYPKGFTDYQGKPSSCSSTIGKYFRENQLLPSENHTVNSLRHTFQDALTAAEAPERVQADLMGHKFKRERYGFGPDLEQKKLWIEKAAFYV